MLLSCCSIRFSTKRPQTEVVPHSTQPTHDLPVTPPVTSPGQSYHLDTIAPVGQQQSENLITELPHHAPSPHPSLELTPVSTEEIPLPQSAPSLPLQESHSNRDLPEFVNKSDIYREWQVTGDGLCEKCALNTVSYKFFGKKKITTTEEFKQKIAGNHPTIDELRKIAREKDLKTKLYHTAKLGEAGIVSIDDTEAFIIRVPGSPPLFHSVALVQTKEGYCLSDSSDQDKREIYPGTATEAFLEYQRRNNLTAHAVITFHKRVPAHSPEFNAKDSYDDGIEFFDRSLWKEAIEEFDEVVTHFRKAKVPELPMLFAKALYNKGSALCKLKEWSKAIDTYNMLETCFGKAKELELRELIANGRRYKNFALRKRSGEQT